MSPRPWRPARTGTAVLGAVLAASVLSACAGGPPGAAAVVDGRVVTDAEIQTFVAELPPEITQGAPVDPAFVVTVAAVEGPVREVAARYTGIVSDADVRQQFEQAAGRPLELSDSTLRLLATNAMAAQVTETDVAREEFLALVAELDVEVSPRYGEFSPTDLAVQPTQPEWLRPVGGGQTQLGG